MEKTLSASFFFFSSASFSFFRFLLWNACVHSAPERLRSRACSPLANGWSRSNATAGVFPFFVVDMFFFDVCVV